MYHFYLKANKELASLFLGIQDSKVYSPLSFGSEKGDHDILYSIRVEKWENFVEL